MDNKKEIIERLNSLSKDELVNMIVDANDKIESLVSKCNEMREYISRNNTIKQIVGIMSLPNVENVMGTEFILKARATINNYYFGEESKDK